MTHRTDLNEYEPDVFTTERVSFEDDMAVSILSQALEKVLGQANGRDIVIVCVGTDRSTGDAFGPIVGSKLAGLKGVRVYGSLEEPVHAVNLASTLDLIHNSKSGKPFILAIDACLGKFDHVGQIIIERGPLRPGAGVKKSLPEFGDYTITGVVNVSGFMEYFVLQNTRLNVVMKMSDIVVQALKMSIRRFETRQRLVGVNELP